LYILGHNSRHTAAFSYIYFIMLRQIITPLESSFTLQFPNDMIGKKIEIIAFELKDQTKEPEINSESDRLLRLKRIEELTKDKMVDLSNFKFNRDEANNYDE
jgi:hypothetical protein